MSTIDEVGRIGRASVCADDVRVATLESLSAVKIAVTTRESVVHLLGPAPDQKARERAEVLAALPSGVVSVDNRLVVPAQTQVN